VRPWTALSVVGGVGAGIFAFFIFFPLAHRGLNSQLTGHSRERERG